MMCFLQSSRLSPSSFRHNLSHPLTHTLSHVISYSYHTSKPFSHRDYLPHRSDKDDEENVGGDGRGEEKPFLSALIQSSLPDDVFHDLRRVAKGQELLSPSANQHPSG